ncbi:MAG TPA: ABC transporter permease [Terriglobia bacterium]|nr:ABC transporter permease [Terriglobia bacterium]
MAIPISYNLRNLMVRKTTTIMTALGIALTVAVLLAILALVKGLHTSLHATGNPLHVLVLRNGSATELVSNFTRTGFQVLKDKPGIARDGSGQPEASLELVTIINLANADNPDGQNITLRGITPVGLELRPGLKLTAGRWFQTGKRELVVGESIADRFPTAALGQQLRIGSADWDVVGVMSAGQSATNSEIFADLNQLSTDQHRTAVLSSALVQATDPVAADALIKNIENDQQLNMTALSEQEYYDKQTSSGAPVEFLGIFCSIIMAVGSAFAAMNTMYAAVARRTAEIGTLRVLGFSRGSVLLSFLIEAVLLSAIGGLLGCILVLPLNGITTSIGNFMTFSQTAFNLEVTPAIVLEGVVFAMVLGAFGGLFPSFNAARKEIVAALRSA